VRRRRSKRRAVEKGRQMGYDACGNGVTGVQNDKGNGRGDGSGHGTGLDNEGTAAEDDDEDEERQAGGFRPFVSRTCKSGRVLALACW
jgi:hypothetical protein